jgi:hypothetical protein
MNMRKVAVYLFGVGMIAIGAVLVGVGFESHRGFLVTVGLWSFGVGIVASVLSDG